MEEFSPYIVNFLIEVGDRHKLILSESVELLGLNSGVWDLWRDKVEGDEDSWPTIFDV